MNTTTATSTLTKSLKALAAAVVGLVALVSFAGTAHAYVGEARSVSYAGASGTATLTRFSGGTAKATVRLNRGSSSRCVYVQAAPYAYAAVDGGWKTVSGSRTCGSSTSYYSDNFHLAYNGIKFRVCQDVSLASDTCGSVTYIKG